MDTVFLTALELARDLTASPASIEKVARKTSSPEAARWAFGQWDYRKRGKVKFSRAEEMLFIREALEQATHERVAAYHASLFPPGVPVADLTAGIGSDLIALASRGPVNGFELDSERAEYARHNLAVYGQTAEVRVQDSLAYLSGHPEEFPYAFADPARRVEGRRTLRLDEFSPDPGSLAELFSTRHLGIQKLSPMLADDLLESLGPRVEFVSFGGECREALIFAGREAGEGWSAVQVESGERLPRGPLPVTTETPLGYFFDADPAAVRAHGLGALCARHDLVPLEGSNGYLTGETPVTSPWLRTYRVLYSGKADTKATRRALRDLDAATPELKQRGAGLNLIEERKNYRSEGSRAVSLAIWSIGKSLRHVILEAN